MSPLRFLLAGIAALWAGLAGETRAASQSERSMAATVALVKTDRTGAAAGSTRASGFVWPDARHVVTAFHVVAGANAVWVSYDDGANLLRAQVVKTLPNRDLALLAIDQPREGLPAVLLADERPAPRSAVTAIGYPQGVASRLPITGTIRAQGQGIAAETLGELLSEGKLRQELDALGFPSLDEPILLLQASVSPGLSGAPLFNPAGELVGIVNGGLEKGFGEVTWAIPTEALEQLARQRGVAAMNINMSRLTTLFGAELEAADSRTQSGGALRYTKLRTRTLGQLTNLNDDPIGLMQAANDLVRQLTIASGSFFSPENPHTWEFDLYRVDLAQAPPGTPAVVIALPTGTELEPGARPNELRARLAGGNLRWKTRVQPATLETLPSLAAEFERNVMEQAPYSNWGVNYNWSYPGPRWWPNGMSVERRSLNAYPQNYLPTPWEPPHEAATVLHSSFRGVLVSAALVSLDHAAMMNGALNPALRSEAAVERHQQWSRLAIATMMSGFNEPLTLEGQASDLPPANW